MKSFFFLFWESKALTTFALAIYGPSWDLLRIYSGGADSPPHNEAIWKVQRKVANKQTNNAETSTICQSNMQGGKRAATATCSDTSLTWWQTRFRWVAPRELVLTNFFLLLIIFLVIIVLFSCRLAEAVVFLKAGGGGNLRFDSF